MYIYRTYITLQNGQRIYAKQYGIKAFRFWVDDEKDDVKKRY